MNLWHALRRECTGAWRSVRYDLATHRAAKVAGAYTEEFQPGGPPVPAPSRMVPLTGVTLLLAGGAAGAFLAISGGLAALEDPAGPARGQNRAVAASTPSAEAEGPRTAASPVTPRRAANPTRPSPTPEPTVPPAPPPQPVIEGTTPVTSTSASAGPDAGPSASSPGPSTSTAPSAPATASQSSGGNTEGPRSRGHRGRR